MVGTKSCDKSLFEFHFTSNHRPFALSSAVSVGKYKGQDQTECEKSDPKKHFQFV